MQNQNEKLALWQRRLAESEREWGGETGRMNHRERLYRGQRTMRPLTPGDHKRDGQPRKTSHVRNIVFENIESQVSSAIPQPKVTPRRKKDERLAEIIEHFLRNELDRLPFETINDMAERTVPLQGGVGFLVEWDNSKRSGGAVGELAVSVIHPKQFAPQPGVYTGIEDMDWFILKIPTTKEAVRRRYGADVSREGEAEPEVRSAGGPGVSDYAVTEYIGFAKNDRGGIDRYTWVGDTELEDLENYQARRQPVCARCGRVRPLPGQILGSSLEDTLAGPETPGPSEREEAGRLLAEQIAGGGAPALAGAAEAAAAPNAYQGGPCPWCGAEEWTDREQDLELVLLPVETPTGVRIPGMTPGFAPDGSPAMLPTAIPFYRPDRYPIILQRSVSVYGQLLGSSDADQIADQQNTINRIEQKIIDRLVKAGTRITLPDRADLRTDPEDGERWFIGNPADKALIGVYDFSGNLEYELAYLAGVYEEARQLLGITDSFQGRQDSTATSGKAKEFSAAQAAGRLESKRTMKNAAYAAIFEMMFQFALAYSDEPRSVSFKNSAGETEYQEFNRYDFLERDEDGQWRWNDQFLFSCDTSAPLASNREALWQETRQNLQTGAFGDPAATETLILFWSKMEELHYPGAGTTKQFLEDRLERERMAAMPAALPGPGPQAGNDGSPGGLTPDIPNSLPQAIGALARQDAEHAVQGGSLAI